MLVRTTKTTILAAAMVLFGSIGRGQTSSNPIDQVEEDWVLVIATPNSFEVGPQITTCMSPVSDGSTPFVAFDLNYQDYPSFVAGGLQAKVYSGPNGTVQSSSSQGSASLQTTGETITWTQRLNLTGGNTLTYSIVNGQSTTWGAFGASQGLGPLTFTAPMTSLASYSPNTSVNNSGVGWQSNRVTKMTLVQVRYYSQGRLISTDTTSRSVNLTAASSS
jgi:hypothetical protein